MNKVTFVINYRNKGYFLIYILNGVPFNWYCINLMSKTKLTLLIEIKNQTNRYIKVPSFNVPSYNVRGYIQLKILLSSSSSFERIISRIGTWLTR